MPRFLEHHASPGHTFLAGLLTIPAFIFVEDVILKGVLAAFFLAAALLAGKRIKFLFFILLCFWIVVFESLIPAGRVLISLGPFDITTGALERGLRKGFTIIGLVFVSLATVRRDLRLPGQFGGLLARVFFYFERIFERRKGLQVKDLIASLDRILFDLFDPESPGVDPPEGAVTRTDVLGGAALVLVVATTWTLLVLDRMVI
jgi:hypothetical protein